MSDEAIKAHERKVLRETFKDALDRYDAEAADDPGFLVLVVAAEAYLRLCGGQLDIATWLLHSAAEDAALQCRAEGAPDGDD
jgi:hypothetical protein